MSNEKKTENKKENKAAENEIEPTVMFKKVGRGFDRAEVMAYVEEMNRTMQDASKNYEKRMAEMKAALALANRERDTVLARYGGEAADAEALANEERSQLDEAQATIAGLKDKIEEAHAERSRLEAEMQKKLEDERALRESLEKELETASAKIEGLYQRIEEFQSVQSQYEQALGTIEEQKAKMQAILEEKELQAAEYATAQTHFEKVESENVSIKTELSRTHVENTLLEEKNETYKKQIAQMKKEIKEKAYAYAEKLSAGEDELRKEQVKLQKKVQMQNYHIEQANTAIKELTSQLQAIQESFAE